MWCYIYALIKEGSMYVVLYLCFNLKRIHVCGVISMLSLKKDPCMWCYIYALIKEGSMYVVLYLCFN